MTDIEIQSFKPPGLCWKVLGESVCIQPEGHDPQCGRGWSIYAAWRRSVHGAGSTSGVSLFRGSLAALDYLVELYRSIENSSTVRLDEHSKLRAAIGGMLPNDVAKALFGLGGRYR